jgi:transcriptional regulator with XRE-family HTH domain
MKRTRTDLLLQLAFVEGTMTTHGLYEKTAARKKPEALSSPEAKAAMVRKLEAALAKKAALAKAPLTLGLFLRNAREEQSLKPEEIFGRLGISSNLYKLLERDKISPLKIAPESWIKMQQLFKLPFEALEEMIRRTFQLVFFRPSFRTTLARYDGRKKKASKGSVLERAAEELYARASLTLPRQEEEKISQLLAAIKRKR